MELENIKLAEEAPEAVGGGLFGAERGRVFEDGAEIGELRSKPREDRLQRLLVVGEEVVPPALVVVQLADLAELETSIALCLLLLHPLQSDGYERFGEVSD